MGMAESSYSIRGRQIDGQEIETIRDLIRGNEFLGRTAISRLLCEQWHWEQSNGRLKDRACRVLLLALESKGVIKLPARLRVRESFNRRGPALPDLCEIDREAVTGKVSDFRSLTIEMVRFTPKEKLWDHLVHTYHYLGHPWIVGSYLKYMAYLDGRLVACLGWGSASWKVACRDRFIGWSTPLRKKNLTQVVNNVRFLIFPWVKVEHLASKVLAANIKRLAADWHSLYQEPIVLLETFVDVARFQGTCYRAANWRYVGETRGIAKSGNGHCYHGQPKAVYLYPLTKDFRGRLHA